MDDTDTFICVANFCSISIARSSKDTAEVCERSQTTSAFAPSSVVCVRLRTKFLQSAQSLVQLLLVDLSALVKGSLLAS